MRSLCAGHLFALVFVVYATVAILLCAILVPPFENPDEFNHYNRANLVATGAIMATRYAGPDTSGGKVDIGTDMTDSIIGTVRFHPERKVTGAMLQAARAVHWGRRIHLTFDNTAIYPPFFYLPAALGMRIGWALHETVVNTLILSRLLTGLACVGVATASIAAAGAAAPWLFTMLCLPMALTQFASVSQDGLMFAAAALSMTCLVRLGRDPGWSRWLLLLCISLDLIIMARPPYAPIAIIPLLLPSLTARQRIGATTLVVAPALAWSGTMVTFTAINAHVAAGVNPSTQLLHLLTHPGRWSMLVRNTYAHQGLTGLPFIDEFIGLLGWTDLRLPSSYYTTAKVVLAVALVTACTRSTPTFLPAARALVFGALLASSLTLFIFEYASWDTLDADRVNGIQGRYFIPLAMLIAAVLPVIRLPRLLLTATNALLLAFPALSVAILTDGIVLRYYV